MPLYTNGNTQGLLGSGPLTVVHSEAKIIGKIADQSLQCSTLSLQTMDKA